MEAQNLNDFNQKFSTKATLCSDMEVGWDLDGCSKWLFYEQLEDQRKATLGQVLYRCLGSLCTGPYYASKGMEGFRLYCSETSREHIFYPLSNYSATRRIDIGYRSSKLRGVEVRSTVSFERWWIRSFSELQKSCPDEAALVYQFLIEEIRCLGNAARSGGHKSGWVYHQFVAKQDYFEKRINYDFLVYTSYIFDPILFYNKFSYKLVSLTRSEAQELRAKSIPDDTCW